MSIWKIKILQIGITASINNILVLICYEKTKFNYFRNLNVKDLNNNKKFWKKIKSLFSDKGLASNKIVLKEEGTDNQELVNLCNTFINITDTLPLKISISLWSYFVWWEQHF